MAMSEHAVMAKVRGRIRREIAKAEDDEGAGEINLVPYLDIVVNTVIFLLATVSVTLPLANINVNSPKYEEASMGQTSADNPDDQKRLNLTVAISYTGYIVAGAGGVMDGPDGKPPTVKCSVPLQVERCPAFLATRTKGGETEYVWVDKYDYKRLTELVTKIKEKFPAERQAILTADRLIPYKVVIDTMDALRGKHAKCLDYEKDAKGQKTATCVKDACNAKEGCLFDQVILSAGVQ
jgi:biopolymer transport protein ExbD